MERLMDEQWTRVAPHIPKHRAGKRGGRPAATTAAVSRGSFGSCAPALGGKTCPKHTRARRPAGGGSTSGSATTSGSRSGARSSRSSISRANRLERVLHGWDVRPGQKRGLCVGPTRKGKGTKCMVLVDG